MDSNWRSELDAIIRHMKAATGHREFSLQGIIGRIRPPTTEVLAADLSERIRRGELKVVYRILSRETKSGIEEVSRITDIPDEVYDENIDQSFHVEPDRDVEIVYQLPAPARC